MTNKQNYVVIDENPFNYLSENYNSLTPPKDFYRDGTFTTYKIPSNINPPLDYQNKLVANNFPYQGNTYFHKEYPELTQKEYPRTHSADFYSRETLKDVNLTTVQNNINAGIPPVQVNPDIATSDFQSVKMPTGYSLPRRNCMEYISHCRKCPACIRYFDYEKNQYRMIIVMILVVAAVIIWFLYKDIRLLKKLSKTD